mgnify:CR=1 FL=1
MQWAVNDLNGQWNAAELEMLQRTFDRVCLWQNIPPNSPRAGRLVRYLTDQLRGGISDEGTLFENAMLLERSRSEASSFPRRGSPMRVLN